MQEVAFTLANGLAYLEALRDAGLIMEQRAARFSFFFAAHNDFFEEVAKFRAARRLWARLLQGAIRRKRLRCAVTAFSHPDRRFHADRAASRKTI